MKKQTIIASLALATGLALTGCSGSPEATQETPSPSPTASASPSASPTAETYKLDQAFSAITPDGVHITVDFTTEAPADVEAARTSLGAEPVSYAKVTVDNRKGSERVGAYPVTVYDEAGDAYEFNDLSGVVSDWDMESDIVEVTNEYMNQNNIDPMEKGGGYLASLEPKLPETVTGVTIDAYKAGEPIYLTPAPENDQGKTETSVPTPSPAAAPATPQTAPKSALEMTPEEAMRAAASGQITLDEYCQRDSFFTSGDTQMCHFHNNPDAGTETPTAGGFNYDQAYAAWQGGMPYYEAFCENYTPVTSGGVSQCEGINAGTVDYYTGEYIGDQTRTIPEGKGFGCHKDENGMDYCIDPAPIP